MRQNLYRTGKLESMTSLNFDIEEEKEDQEVEDDEIKQANLGDDSQIVLKRKSTQHNKSPTRQQATKRHLSINFNSFGMQPDQTVPESNRESGAHTSIITETFDNYDGDSMSPIHFNAEGSTAKKNFEYQKFILQ